MQNIVRRRSLCSKRSLRQIYDCLREQARSQRRSTDLVAEFLLKGVPKGIEVGEDPIGLGVVELFGVVRAGGDAPAGKATVVRGFDIEGGIADEQGGGGSGA